jgi:large subunit ribosomal protein L4
MTDKDEKTEEQNAADEAEAQEAEAKEAKAAEPEAAEVEAAEPEAAKVEAEAAEVAEELETTDATLAEEAAAEEALVEAAEEEAEAEAKPAAKKPAAKAGAKKAPKKAKAKKKAVRKKAEVNVPTVTLVPQKDAGLSPEVFEVEPSVGVLHEVVRAEAASLRRGTASTKTRGEVRGGGKKPWRQKGTGRARAGSSRIPHWTGGGITFGPTPRDYNFKVNRKVRSKALKMALSARAREGGLRVVDSLAFEEPKTAAAAAVLDSLDVTYPLLVLVTEADTNAAISFRNLLSVEVTDTSDLMVSDILGARTVLASKEVVAELNRIGEGK